VSRPGPGTDFAGINRRLSQIKYEVEIVTDRCEKAGLALEAIVKEAE